MTEKSVHDRERQPTDLGVAGKLKKSLDFLDRFQLSFFYTNFPAKFFFCTINFL